MNNNFESNKSNNKKKNIFLFILILILLFLIIRMTYSKYVNSGSALIFRDIARWNIKVNGTDITDDIENYYDKEKEEYDKTKVIDGYIKFNVENFKWDWESAPHVKEPNVAPGMKGSFEIEVDPKDTDVSLEYTITLDDKAIEKAINDSLAELEKENEQNEPTNTVRNDVIIVNTDYSEITNEVVDDNETVDPGNEDTGAGDEGDSETGDNDDEEDDDNDEEDDEEEEPELTNPKINLRISKITRNGEEVTEVKRDKKTKQIYLVMRKSLAEIQSTDDAVRKDKIIVEVEWVNNEDNNDTDSLIGAASNRKIELPIIMKFSQYIATEEEENVDNTVSEEEENP